MPDLSPAIILVRPQMGENIGAAARAMMNFGITDLRLVAPRDGWPNPAAINMGAGAFDHMPEPQVFDTLAESLEDCHFSYATTARKRDMVKEVLTPAQATQNAQKREEEGQKVAFIFGPERTGLENEDLTLSQCLINIPTDPNFSSLNLGQSVLLLLYQYFIEDLSETDLTAAQAKKHKPAPQATLHAFTNRLEQTLDEHHFFRTAEAKASLSQQIRTFFSRSAPSEQEVGILHGIVSALLGNKTPD